ncbi:uncharacterized protein LOC143983591 [Lithobates pipiens]
MEPSQTINLAKPGEPEKRREVKRGRARTEIENEPTCEQARRGPENRRIRPALCKTFTRSSSSLYSTCWATNLNLLLDPEDWAEIWISTKSSTIKILAMEANQNVFAGCYIVPARVSKIDLYNSQNCFRVCEEPGTHLHAFLMLSKLINSPVSPDPAVLLLNKRPPDLTLAQLKHVLYITAMSKETFAKTLKTPKLCLLKTKHRITQALTHSTIG